MKKKHINEILKRYADSCKGEKAQDLKNLSVSAHEQHQPSRRIYGKLAAAVCACALILSFVVVPLYLDGDQTPSDNGGFPTLSEPLIEGEKLSVSLSALSNICVVKWEGIGTSSTNFTTLPTEIRTTATTTAPPTASETTMPTDTVTAETTDISNVTGETQSTGETQGTADTAGTADTVGTAYTGSMAEMTTAPKQTTVRSPSTALMPHRTTASTVGENIVPNKRYFTVEECLSDSQSIDFFEQTISPTVLCTGLTVSKLTYERTLVGMSLELQTRAPYVTHVTAYCISSSYEINELSAYKNLMQGEQWNGFYLRYAYGGDMAYVYFADGGVEWYLQIRYETGVPIGMLMDEIFG